MHAEHFRRPGFRLAVSCAAGVCAAVSGAVRADDAGSRGAPPNILLIMSDQHSKHFLGCYGDRLVRTPHLDALAAQGMRFTNAYCAAPLCVPSRTSFLTGRFPSRNRVNSNAAILGSGIPTWAHVLAAAGYETSLIGRMHFEGPDQRHGFMNRPIGEYGARHPGSPRRGATPGGPVHYHGGSGQSRSSVTEAGRGTTTYQHMDERITAAACDYLRARAQQRDRPFAAVVGFVLPHNPFIARRDLFDFYYDRVAMPRVADDLPPTILRFQRQRGIDRPLTEEQTRVARAAYYGLCEHLDSMIGQILACLDETKLAERTLVVYCSDHGEMAGEHGCWWKSTYYEGSIGSPLIARLPGTIAPGSVCDAVCSLLDIGPTFTDLAGAGAMPGADGRSLWSTLQGRHPPDWKDETYAEFCDRGTEYLPSRMIRSGAWKLWYYADAENLPPALFDLEADPREMHDLGRDPAHAAVRQRLLDRLLEHWDPRAVQQDTREAEQDYAVLVRWGRAVQPDNPDALDVPGRELEADVELK